MSSDHASDSRSRHQIPTILNAKNLATHHNAIEVRSKAMQNLDSREKHGAIRAQSPHAQTSRSNIPELNIVTSFSQHKSRSRDKSSVSSQQDSYHARKESIQHRRKRSKQNGSKAPLDSLRNDEGKIFELSPSDRTLVIGIDDMVGTKDRSLHVNGNLSRYHQPITPEIIITPADLKSHWSVSPESALSTRRRATSSIYSRATQLFGSSERMADGSPVPPMPPIPRHQLPGPQRPLSHESWATEFSDDDTLNRGPSRPRSGESQLAVLDQDGEDVILSARSHGWWNQILSPFLDRSATSATKKSPASGSISDSIWKDTGTSPKLKDNCAAKDNRRTSIWADLTGVRAAHPALPFFSTESKDPNFNDYPGVHRGELVSTPELVESQKRGLAGDYYRACWHDQNRRTPYFDCENHSCSYGHRESPEIGVASSAGRGLNPDASDIKADSTHLNGVTGYIDAEQAIDEINRERGFHQAPENRFSAAFRTAASAHSRSDSESTEIEEDTDETPDVQEARAAPVVQAARLVSKVRPNRLRDLDPAAQSRGTPETLPMQPLPRPMPPPRTDSLADKPLPPIRSQEPLSPGLAQSKPGEAFTTRSVAPTNFSADTPESRIPGRFAEKIGSSEEQKRPGDEAIQENRERGDPFADSNQTNDNFGIYNWDKPRPAPLLPQLDRSRQHLDPENAELAASRGFVPPPSAVETIFYPPPPTRYAESYGHDDMNEKGFAQGKAKPKGSWLAKLWGQSQKTKPKDKKRRCRFFMILGLLLAMVLLIVVLVLTLTLNRNDIPVQTSWLNITNYPPIPTGIATIVRPNAKSTDGCIQPNTMWSCALPKEQQQSITPNSPDQPNFRVEIRFENGTNMTNSSSFHKRGAADSLGMSATRFFKSRFLKVRDSFTNSLYQPNPLPPSVEEQAFLGNTTDGNDAPHGGESTPFFMSFLPAGQVSAKLRMAKRQDNNSTNSSNPFPNISNDIPPPATNSDGTAASANLLPYPSAQPLMLYNRGRSDEHYGFYSYFDRSIFLKSASLANVSTAGEVPDDEDGGAQETAASLRCTWAQTRFLVQIWTAASSDLRLLPSSNSSAATPTGSQGAQATQTPAAGATSADDFARPGSFPYPVTITLDRHGGDIGLKSVYCYGMDDRERIIGDEKQFQLENRAFQGKLANPAQGLFSHVNVSLADGGPGGIDGGTGGCACEWTNFQTG